MGIYIKGMEMPLSCGYCQLKQFTLGVGDDCLVGAKETEYQKRPADCPLTPVPPHGRLINARELRQACYQHYEDFMNGKINGETALLNIEKEIIGAPTIIPAVEGE